MRVTETKPTGKITVMGKKKHKKRKQDHELCPSDSSDEGGNTGIAFFLCFSQCSRVLISSTL